MDWSADQLAAARLHLDQCGPDIAADAIALEERKSLVLIPLHSPRGSIRRIAVGFLSEECIRSLPHVVDLLRRQTDLHRSNRHQMRLLEQYSEQASIDFEELSWFRTLVDQLAFRDDTCGLTNSAIQALKRMNQLTGAESLVLVLRTPPTEDEEELQQIYQIGEKPIHATDVTRLLELAGVNAVCETYIDQQVRQLSICPQGHSQGVVIVPAICSRRSFGWLIAISSPRQDDADEYVWELHSSERRFNDRTALVMESAASILATQAHNRRLLQEQQDLLLGTVRSLVNTIDTKDRYTWGHSDRVAQIARAVAKEHGLCNQECEKIYLAGLLHDIGKIGVRDEVLQKPGGLTADEFEEIKQHPVFGFEILKHLSQLKHVLPGVLHHHESWDGQGYPHQLRDYEIPLAARILAVADAYDAMTSDRPYRKGMPAENAERILREGAGSQWDVDIIEAFFRIIDQVHEISSRVSAPLVPASGMDPAERIQMIRERHLDPLLTAILTTTTDTDTKPKTVDNGSVPDELDDTSIFSETQLFSMNSFRSPPQV
ncbi:HD-GYP domain-containing protein [Rubinisphaera margarita]|uniref:HD-GYP domain-containing protein n=1 Tax=Rubinisphaera margarita TaxID=2909586 RepID=UPI001EE92BDD|nr:HD-GYP domain-containing protein [Rubinisphaera margarita]MCG6155746.1 HD-GYP domain-containing protein [Rubinisphaera margarita]